MKILYAIQGTGNGHITRAMEVVPILKRKGEVDILISGTESDLKLPFAVKYKFKGLCFVFGKHGGVDLFHTYMKMNSLRLLREIKSFPVEQYDLIISDFEPVSAWAAVLAKKPSIGMSNQVASLHPLAPKPKKTDLIGKMVLEHYAPTTFNYGFHYKSLDKNIYTPIIRRQVREMKVTNKSHYTVYLPSYDDERILKFLKEFKNVEWQVFSKHNKKVYDRKNISIQPLNNELFLESMASSTGVLCNAGFGVTSEALFLKKKLMVIPMKTQYEQQCNVAMLKSMGVATMKKVKNKQKYVDKAADWLVDKKLVKVNYPDMTEEIIDLIIENHAGKTIETTFEHSHYPMFQ